MATKKINSDFFDGFSTETDDEVANNKTPRVSDNGAEEVEDVEVEFEDDEEEDLEEEDEATETNDVEDEEGEEDPFESTINHLAEAGLIEFDEDHEYEEEGEELLEKVFSETLEKRFQREYVDAIPEDYQSLFKHLQAGGKLEDWVDAVKPTDFDSVDIDDEVTQKSLIEDHLLSTGLDEDDVAEKVQEYEDLGTLEKEAKRAIKYLKKNEEGKTKAYEQELDRTIQLQREQEKAQFEDFKKTVLSTETLKDVKLSKDKREKLFNHITKATNKQGESQFVINQKNMENQLLLAYMDMEGFSFKDLEKKATTKAASGLRKALTNFTDKNAKSSGGATGRATTESRKIPSGVWDVNTDIED